MGVTGLLPQLKEIQESVSLEKLRGKTVAIDSYAWLHKGAFACAWELAQNLHTTRYLSFFQKRVALLRNFQIEPYFVFDGDEFGSKQGTEAGRARNRQINREKGMECLERGDKKGAHGYFSVCVDVTPAMAKTVIEYLKSEGISYIVAPYEADAQMVYLEKQGLVDAIISEDSDLLIFGAKVLLTKLNEFGECIEIRRENFKNCRNVPIGLMTESQLRIVACLSGCDYTNGIPGVGIVTAFKLAKRISSMKRCLMSLRLEGKRVPNGFEEEYARADLSFQYQRVFDPVNKTITTLNEILELDMNNELLEDSIGPLLDNDMHYKISVGDIDPITKQTLITREASLGQSLEGSAPLSSKSFMSVQSQKRPVRSHPKNTPLKTHSLPLKISQSRTTPISMGIDSFFQIKSATSKRSVTLPAFNTEPPLSPTSKRRKLFQKEVPTTPQVSSRFFAKARAETEPVIPIRSAQETPLLIEDSPSDGELTDVDLDKIEGDQGDVNEENGSKIQPTKPTPIEVTGEESEINVSLDEDSDSDKENLPDTQRILDDLQTVVYEDTISSNGSVKQNIRAGLFERYGFKSQETAHSWMSAPLKSHKAHSHSQSHSHSNGRRIPLTPLHTVDNKARVVADTTLVKSKRGITRNLTLDSFIYRG